MQKGGDEMSEDVKFDGLANWSPLGTKDEWKREVLVADERMPRNAVMIVPRRSGKTAMQRVIAAAFRARVRYRCAMQGLATALLVVVRAHRYRLVELERRRETRVGWDPYGEGE